MLYSIDLPDEGILKMIPPKERQGLKSGWLVPEELRRKWRLILGKSQEKLASLLERLPKIGIFIHDSEHSYENMMWEYRVALSYLKSGGILLSDDVNLNNAFHNFCKEVRMRYTVIIDPLAGLKKP